MRSSFNNLNQHNNISHPSSSKYESVRIFTDEYQDEKLLHQEKYKNYWRPKEINPVQNEDVSSDSHHLYKSTSSNVVGLFVGGMNGYTTEEQLASYFGGYGQVLRVTIVKNRMKRWSSGFGFIYIETDLNSSDLLAVDHYLQGNYLDCSELVEKKSFETIQRDEQNLKLFVGGLPKNLPDEILRGYFSQVAPISKAYVVRDNKSGKTRGFGFLIMLDNQGVEKVLDSAPHYIMGQLIQLKRSKSRTQIQLEAKNSKNTKAGEKISAKQISRQKNPLSEGLNKNLNNFGGLERELEEQIFSNNYKKQRCLNQKNPINRKKILKDQKILKNCPKYSIKASTLLKNGSFFSKSNKVKITTTTTTKMYPQGLYYQLIMSRSRCSLDQLSRRQPDRFGIDRFKKRSNPANYTEVQVPQLYGNERSEVIARGGSSEALRELVFILKK